MKSLYGLFRLVNVVDKKYPFNTEDIIAIKALTNKNCVILMHFFYMSGHVILTYFLMVF